MFRRLAVRVSVVLALCCASLSFAQSAPKRVLIDTDPGSDDALAILLALNSPELKVEALTVVPGNVVAEQGLENALKLVSLANRCDIPVAGGAKHPLNQKLITAEYWHGKNGLANVELPAPKCKAIRASVLTSSSNSSTNIPMSSRSFPLVRSPTSRLPSPKIHPSLAS